MPSNRRTRQTKGRNAKRAKTSTTDANRDAEVETPAAVTVTAPQAFMLQTMFKDAKAAPEGFNGYKGFADGSTTKGCIRTVPPEAYSDGTIDWDHLGIMCIDLDADLAI